MDGDFRCKYRWNTNSATQISMFFINLLTLRAFLLWRISVQYGKHRNAKFSTQFPGLWDWKYRSIMVEHHGRNGDVSIGFLPSAFHTILMQLILYFSCPVHFIMVWILLVVFEFWKAQGKEQGTVWWERGKESRWKWWRCRICVEVKSELQQFLLKLLSQR